MEFGSVKPATLEDFQNILNLINETEDWLLSYNKKNVQVWTKKNKSSDFHMIKVKTVYTEIKASLLYDVIHDPDYRKVWDPTILEGKEICRLDHTNDIGYYAMQLPKPFSNRDFVTLRSWLDRGKEKFIINHSVNHAAVPEQKNYVRGISYFTGYYILAMESDDIPGCELNYVTQCDPKGNLPSWVVNRATQWLAPKIVEKLSNASHSYEEWKSKNRPDWKPWRNPDQNTLPLMQPQDVEKTTENKEQFFNTKVSV